MCGIAGIFNFNNSPVSLESLKKLTDAIVHRGPDGEGHWINSNKKVGFGHRRLSIIDLSDKAKQPMHFADGRYTITFNGEIYNYIELRKQMLDKGYNFVSESDTEVLMALYDHKKEKCLSDLDGMFAFAIWDEKEQELFCARDRFGEKPFYYCTNQSSFTFSSEIKQFWAVGISKKIKEDKLNAFIEKGETDDYSDPTSTFFHNILQLDASHFLKIKDGKIQTGKYWAIEKDGKQFDGSVEEAAETFLSLLKQSVQFRLRSDVPVGSSLSGGLDSSSIVMLIDKLKLSSQKQSTFSARFKNYAKDEGEHIEKVVNACKNTEVHYTWPDENYFLEVLDKVTFHQDEPYGSASIIAQYAVMELATKNNVTVLLDGQGADEYLAGYLPYYKLYLNQLFYNQKESFEKEYPLFNKYHGQISPYVPISETETVQMKLGRIKRKVLNQSMPYSNTALKEQLTSDTSTGGLKTLLRYADRNSMAHSREIRLPFLSHKLVEFAFTLPDSFILNSGWTKFVLRKAMNNILPKSICWRIDKIGYEPPQDNWLQSPALIDKINKAKGYFKGHPSVNTAQNWRLLLAHQYSN